MKNVLLFFAYCFAILNISNAQSIGSIKIENVSLSQFSQQKAIVLVFTSSHCKFATQYVTRLNNLYNEFNSKGVTFIAVNSNDASMSPSDNPEQMRTISRYNFSYLKDNDQSVAKALGAEKTPEVFILKPAGSQFEVVYKGAIDDNPLDESMVKNTSLKNAIQQTIGGSKPSQGSAVSLGCPIKWGR
ncbi:MAG: redoxin domain-containing protein [Bacteroidia bacterium]|nr:redoxin domain-containing protein [Bacteroidia bacterium]